MNLYYILVLMEDGLREIKRSPDDRNGFVLILVLMEDGLRVQKGYLGRNAFWES